MKQVIIIGGGSSVKEGLETDLWNKIKNLEIWSLNSVFKLMPYEPSVQFWVDKAFFLHEIENLQNLYNKGTKLVSKSDIKQNLLKDYIEQYETTREKKKYNSKKGIEEKLLFRGSMGLCGIFALHYAIAKNYTTIYLLGYDFGTNNLDNKQTHWYQRDIANKNIYSTGANNPSIYLDKNNKTLRFVSDFEVFAQEKGVKIYNVSMISNINYFEKITYQQFYEKIQKNLQTL